MHKEIIDATVAYFQNAEPGAGSITYEPGYRLGKHEDEVSAARFLHQVFGGDICLLAESTEYGVKTPDYLWRGKFWELKAPSTKNSTDNAVRTALRQIQDNPGGIILDFRENEIDIDEITSVVSERILRGELRGIDVIVCSRNMVIKILRYKK